LVRVWVVPGASSTEIVGRHGQAVKIRVAAPPEGGRANRLASRAIAAALGADRALVVSGSASRRKEILVAGMTMRAVRRSLTALGIEIEPDDR
jgi:uncharacterized protein (TIGR00251 family)